MQNMYSCHINQAYNAQSSLRIGSSYGAPNSMPWQNVLREPNRNDPTNDQAQFSLPVGPSHGVPFVRNVTWTAVGRNPGVSSNSSAVSNGNAAVTKRTCNLVSSNDPVVSNNNSVVSNSPAVLNNNSEVLNIQRNSEYQSQPRTWHSGMSPGRYELVALPTNVFKCYGCGQNFADKYRSSPYNIVVKHVDRRIRGRDTSGNIFYNQDFTNTCYHLSKDHIEKKNPVFDGNVFVKHDLLKSLTNLHHTLLSKADLNVRVFQS